MPITDDQLKQIIEAAIMAAGEPLSLDKMLSLFVEEKEPPTRDAAKAAIKLIEEECETRGVELKKVSSGYRFQAKKDFSHWVSQLWEEKPARYSRALLETLVLIAYKQPITRGEIEHVRGVAVSTNIIKTLLERDWVKVVGHRDVPGKPALYATTKAFLDYFNLNSLEQLPTLAEIRDLDKITAELDLQEPGSEQTAEGEAPGDQATDVEVEDVEASLQQENVESTEAEFEAAEEDIDSNLEDRDDIMLSTDETVDDSAETNADIEQPVTDEDTEVEEPQLVAEVEESAIDSTEENVDAEQLTTDESTEAEEPQLVAEIEESVTDSAETEEPTVDSTETNAGTDRQVTDENTEVEEPQLVAETEKSGVDSTKENVVAEQLAADENAGTDEPQLAGEEVVSEETIIEQENLETVATGEEGDEEFSAEDNLDSKFVG